ncbi:UNVERIFIED_CONTAM: MFS transporter, partial [Prevotella sp. 15_C9]
SYTGLVYLTPLIGGYIADKYWGIRRSVFWGAMMMAVGQFLMFASASMLEARELSHWLMYGGLTFLILGNGCFKPTVSSLVGQLYEPGDKR